MTLSVYTLCEFRNLNPVGFCGICGFCGELQAKEIQAKEILGVILPKEPHRNGYLFVMAKVRTKSAIYPIIASAISNGFVSSTSKVCPSTKIHLSIVPVYFNVQIISSDNSEPSFRILAGHFQWQDAKPHMSRSWFGQTYL